MATGTTVFSRVTVVAPRTRIDVALPAGVAVADLLPMLLEMAKESTPDGGARHGGWCLAKLGDNPLDPSRTLASLGGISLPLAPIVAGVTNPLLVTAAARLAPRTAVAAAPLGAWIFTIAVFGMFGPGGDIVLVADWRSLLLFAAGALTGAVAVGRVLANTLAPPR